MNSFKMLWNIPPEGNSSKIHFSDISKIKINIYIWIALKAMNSQFLLNEACIYIYSYIYMFINNDILKNEKYTGIHILYSLFTFFSLYHFIIVKKKNLVNSNQFFIPGSEIRLIFHLVWCIKRKKAVGLLAQFFN